MIKSKFDVLAELKALQLNATTSITNPEGLKYYTLALVSVAALWNLETDFMHATQQMEVLRRNDNLLPLSAAHKNGD